MKRLFIALVALLLLCGSSIAPQVKADARAAVVPLVDPYTVSNDEGAVLQTMEAYCSATKVSPLFLVTAGHCLDETYVNGVKIPDVGQELTFRDTDGSYKTAVVAKIDRPNDLMLLRVHTVCPCAPLAKSMPMRDDDVMALGFPMGPDLHSQQVLTEGSMQVVLDELRMLITAPVTHGNSGGGLFNSKGELVGVVIQLVAAGDGVFMPYIEVNHLALAVRTDVLRAFLDGF